MTASGLKRDLGLTSATSLVVGSMIGVGIFLGPQRIASLVTTPELVLLVWLTGGLFIFFGALTYGELGAALPESGGQYVYIREAFGPAWGFATGWTGFTVAKSASVAALAVGFGEYVGALLGAELTPLGLRVIGVSVIVAVSIVNMVGVKRAGVVQVVTTFLKVGALVALAVGGLIFMSGNAGTVFAGAARPADTTTGSLVALLGLALIPAFFAYDGWVNSTQVAEEVKRPERNVPLSLILGVGIVVLVYAVVNLVYLLALGADAVATSRFAAADTAEALAGPLGRTLIVLAILVSITGTVNAVIMSGPRLTFAMARDRVFHPKLAEIHPKFGTPVRAIVLQGVWSSTLVLLPPIGDLPLFETLLTYVVFDSFVFYLLGAVAVFILRAKRPDLHRPYKAWGYPVVPALFIFLVGAFLVNTLLQSPREAAAGLALILVGLPFYFYWRRRPPDSGEPPHPRVVRNVTYSWKRDA